MWRMLAWARRTSAAVGVATPHSTLQLGLRLRGSSVDLTVAPSTRTTGRAKDKGDEQANDFRVVDPAGGIKKQQIQTFAHPGTLWL
jgi:hypothetical protein